MAIHACSNSSEFDSYFNQIIHMQPTDRIEMKKTKTGEIIPIIHKSTFFIRVLEFFRIWKPLSYRQAYVKDKMIEFFQKNSVFFANYKQSRLASCISILDYKLYYHNKLNTLTQAVTQFAGKVFFQHTPHSEAADFLKHDNATKDCTIYCQDGEITAHFDLLQKFAVLKNMGNASQSLEEEEPKITEVYLKDFTVGCVKIFLDKVYDESLPDCLDASEVLEVARLADFLNNDELLQDCDNFLLQWLKLYPDALDIYTLFQPEYEGLKMCRVHCSQSCKFSLMANDKNLASLPYDAVVYLLKNKTESDDAALYFLYKWALAVAETTDGQLTIKDLLGKKSAKKETSGQDLDEVFDGEYSERHLLSYIDYNKLCAQNKQFFIQNEGVQSVTLNEPCKLIVAGFNEKLKAFQERGQTGMYLYSDQFSFGSQIYSVGLYWKAESDSIGVFLTTKDTINAPTVINLTLSISDKTQSYSTDFKGCESWGWNFWDTRSSFESYLNPQGDLKISVEFT